MYRDETEALRERVQLLESQLGAIRARAERAEQRLDAIARQEPDPLLAARMPSVRMVAGLLVFVGLCTLALMIMVWPAYMAIAHEDPVPGVPPALQGALMAMAVDTFFVPLLATSLGGGVGLWRGRTWGYAAALCASVLCCLACVPVGVCVLVVLLRSEVRQGFFPPIQPLAPAAEPRS